MRHKLLDSHANVKDLNLLEAKMNFVKAWQSLPDFGVSLFVVRFHGEKKDELLGIAYNRIMRMSLQTGDHIKTWRYNTIKVRNTYTQGDLTPIFPTFSNPILNLNFYINADPGSTYMSNIRQNRVELCTNLRFCHQAPIL